MSAQANGMELNRDAFRKVANRIDPKTRPKGIAGFDQLTYGAKVYGAELYGNQWNADGFSECDTVCCIAGHAYILSEGVDAYLEYAENEEALFYAVGDIAQSTLGLTDKQANALFTTILDDEQIHEQFGISVYWSQTGDAEDVADLCRRIADEC